MIGTPSNGAPKPHALAHRNLSSGNPSTRIVPLGGDLWATSCLTGDTKTAGVTSPI